MGRLLLRSLAIAAAIGAFVYLRGKSSRDLSGDAGTVATPARDRASGATDAAGSVARDAASSATQQGEHTAGATVV